MSTVTTSNTVGLATSNTKRSVVVIKDRQVIWAKMGFARKSFDKHAKEYTALEEVGFRMCVNTKLANTYTISVSGIWFSVCGDAKDNIVLTEKTVSKAGLTENTFKFKAEKSEALHRIARQYLLNAQNFKTMKFSRLVELFHDALREQESQESGEKA